VSRVLLLGPAREAAGVRDDQIDGATVADVLRAAAERYGRAFSDVLATSQVWVNGEPTGLDRAVGAHDEVAVLPPISGG
jgi:molybdopterin converting factor small subunit